MQTRGGLSQSAADLQITTEVDSSFITFRCDGADIWPNKKFVAAVNLLGVQDVDANIEGRHY